MARTYRLLAAAGWMPSKAGDLVVAQLLEMPERKHLAVDRVQPIEGLADVGHGLGPLGAPGSAT